MTGLFNPVTGDEDIVWKGVVPVQGADYYAVVDKIHGSTTGGAWLTVFESVEYKAIHRVRTSVTTAATVFGHDSTSEQEWEAEIVKAAMNPEYRRIDASAY